MLVTAASDFCCASSDSRSGLPRAEHLLEADDVAQGLRLPEQQPHPPQSRLGAVDA
jgi:hypothetical protein